MKFVTNLSGQPSPTACMVSTHANRQI